MNSIIPEEGTDAHERLRALVVEAMAIADEHGITMLGIRLDQARIALDREAQPKSDVGKFFLNLAD